MKKFMNQFNLNPILRMQFESFVYRVADKMVIDYDGGVWKSKTVGDTVILIIPYTGMVKLHNHLSGATVETDQVTASAAFTYLVVNWFWNMVAEKISDASNDAFEKCFYAIRDAAYADDSKIIDKNAFYTFTD